MALGQHTGKTEKSQNCSCLYSWHRLTSRLEFPKANLYTTCFIVTWVPVTDSRASPRSRQPKVLRSMILNLLQTSSGLRGESFLWYREEVLSWAASRPFLKFHSLQVPRQICGNRTPACTYLWAHLIKVALESALRTDNRAGAAGQNTSNLNQVAWDSVYPSSHVWTLMAPKEEGEWWGSEGNSFVLVYSFWSIKPKGPAWPVWQRLAL